MSRYILIVLLLSYSFIATAQNVVPDNVERQALMDLYNSTDGANWSISSRWRVTQIQSYPDSIPYGVEVENGDITALSLLGVGLTGSLPSTLGDLTEMKYLVLSYNNLTGTLSDLSNMHQLITLDLTRNDFSGSFPSWLMGITTLTNLYLSSDLSTSTVNISGPIPPGISQLTNLKIFSFEGNDLSMKDAIPASISDCDNLEQLYLSNCQLTDSSFVSGIAGMQRLVNLDLSYNPNMQVNGAMSDVVFNNPSLSILSLVANNFLKLAPSLNELKLDYLALSRNTIYSSSDVLATLVDTLSTMSQLSTINFSECAIDSLPSNFGQLTTVQNLYFNNNPAIIPSQYNVLSEMPNLMRLYMPYCYLTELPDSLVSCEMLESLFLSNNDLYPIPSLIKDIPNLKALWLNANNIQSLPNWFGSGDMNSLEFLDLSNNLIELPIPDSVGYMKQLQSLNLEGNKLNGSLPLVFEELDALYELKLSYNQLDSLSADLSTLTNLRVVHLEHNELTGTLPKVLPPNVPPAQSPLLDVSYNQLDGFVPYDMGPGFKLSVNNNIMTFADILAQPLPIATYSYTPQGLVDSMRTLEAYVGQIIELTANIDTLDSLGCEFQWIKTNNGSITATYPKGVANDTFNVVIGSQDDGAQFYYQITNTLAPQLTLTSRPIIISLIAPPDSLIDFERNHYVLQGDTLVLTTYIHRADSTDTINYLYQWYKYIDGVNDIPVNTGPSVDGHTYTINGVQQSDFGTKYYYKIIDPNDPGHVEISHLQTIVMGSTECTTTLEEQYDALMIFYSATNGDTWVRNDGWRDADPLVPESVSGWYGVKTDNNGFVVSLDLDGIEDFEYQTVNDKADFTGNNLSGYITPELRKLCYLKSLNLGGNNLEGTIPAELGELTELEELILGANDLVGTIPNELGNLTKLEQLVLNSNRLTGSIPSTLDSLTQLQMLDLSENQLSGPLPSLTHLTSLVYLHLRSNRITGPIPSYLESLPNIAHIELDDNLLTGSIPDEIGNATKLQIFDVSNNKLTGSIPATFTGLVFLSVVDISYNHMSDEIPLAILDNPELDSLFVQGNGFTFSDLLPVKNHAPYSLYYVFTPQDSIDVPKIVGVLNDKVKFTTAIDRNADDQVVYQWFWHNPTGEDVPMTSKSPNSHTFVLTDFTMYPEGSQFYYTISDPYSNELTLISHLQTFRLSCSPPAATINIIMEDNYCAVKFIAETDFSVRCSLLRCEWNFGDGTSSTEWSPLHVYGTDGTYNVSLTVSYFCGACPGSSTITKDITFEAGGALLQDSLIQISTDRKEQIINSSASTFADSWPLLYEQQLASQNPFLNGSRGVWRNESSYAYQVKRDRSAETNIAKDGTYSMEQFSWQYSGLDLVPHWIKANTMTRYSPFSYELENRDVLGVYSAAVYDYGGHLPSATGVNMKNTEMAFTSFEYLNGFMTGNWIFGSEPGPAQAEYKILVGRDHKLVIEAPLSALEDVERMDVVHGSFFNREITPVRVVCMVQDPSHADRTIVIIDLDFHVFYLGTVIITNDVAPTLTPVLDTLAHTGKSSLKISTNTTFKQEFLKLESNRNYWISAWVSVNNPYVTTPKLADGLGFNVVVRNDNDQIIASHAINPTGRIIEGWQQVKGSFNVPEGSTIELEFLPGSTGTAWYDDLRLHPENGNMKSYVYNLTDYRLQAILDEENFASFFYYDAEGNLYLTKKETEKGIKTLTENVSYQRESGGN